MWLATGVRRSTVLPPVPIPVGECDLYVATEGANSARNRSGKRIAGSENNSGLALESDAKSVHRRGKLSGCRTEGRMMFIDQKR